MAEVHVEAKIHLDFNGRKFLAEVEAGGRDALAEIAEEGKAIALSLAPVGHKDDPRTPSIQSSMYSDSDSETARWGSAARHAMAQETGGKRHRQTGWARFFWENAPEGPREWEPGPNQIKHPGNPAHPYLRPSLDIIYERYGEILRKNIGRRVGS